MPPAFVHRITKYDPADRDEHGSYQGPEEAVSDHGPVEAAYLEAISAFAEAAGIDRLEIREPSVAGRVHLGAQPAVKGHSLGGLFPADLAGYQHAFEDALVARLVAYRESVEAEAGDPAPRSLLPLGSLTLACLAVQVHGWELGVRSGYLPYGLLGSPDALLRAAEGNRNSFGCWAAK